MTEYVGIYYKQRTPEIDSFKNEINQASSTVFQEENTLISFDNDFVEKGHFFENDKVMVLFNGECYNEDSLKSNHQAKTLAEALVNLYLNEGIDSFTSIRGKFTIILRDRSENAFFAVRDHFGVKQLFYYERSDGFVFASSKKGITQFLTEEQVDTVSLQHYLSFQYVPNPMTLTKDIQLVPAGHYLSKEASGSIQMSRYFEPTFHPIITEKSEQIKRIRDALFESVEAHMDNEHSIGSFLSGGIDSTFIASIAKEFKPDIKTFSVGFAREGFSEMNVAEETADKLGLENIGKVITPDEYVGKLPEIMWYLDDPLADPSCVPLYFVANLAKQHVDVSLSGEGADELFGGYNIYREPESLKMFNYVPDAVKPLIRKMAEILPEHMKGKSFIERGTTPLQERYIGNAKMFEEAEKEHILKDYHAGISYQQITAPIFDRVKEENLTTQMQYVDINTWLIGDILLKARKMTEANNLSVRMPFLDKEVFQVAREIPVNLTIADGTTKLILREAARGIIPNHVLDRKKLGFPVPIRHWLKKELNSWAKQLIQESETDAYINKEYVSGLLKAHCDGQADYSRKIWTLLMFMLWHQVFVEQKYNFA